MTRKTVMGIISAVVGIGAALIAIFATRGHINETHKYYDSYQNGMGVLSEIVSGFDTRSTAECMYYIAEIRGEAAAAISDIRGAVDYFEELKVPKKLKDEHNAVLEEIVHERDFLDKIERVFSSKHDDEFRKNCTAAGEAAGKVIGKNSFDSSLDLFVKEMDRLDKFDNTRSGFVWL